MENEYIGKPKNFSIEDDNASINFRKTFDLNGTQNDEMLRLYLRKAGLSDEIECLTAEQRRAFIYDIIKSNKMPGYWFPSTMQRSKMQAPPPPPPQQLPKIERRSPPNSPTTKKYSTMRSSVSTGNLSFFAEAVRPPPSPSSFVTSMKGRRYEISGPCNFKHTAGDMNHDMTRKAFDLASNSNDNVLRKYMMERGITEDDVAGMRKTDLIRKIVQSKFTWMPSKKSKPNTASTAGNLRLNYATISGYPERKTHIRPALDVPPSPMISEKKPDFSNYTLVTSRFTDVRKFPAPEEIYQTKTESSARINVVPLPPLAPGTQLPAPPPRKSQYSSSSLPSIKRNESPILTPPPPPPPPPPQPEVYEKCYQDYDNFMMLRIQKPNEPDYASVEDVRINKKPTPPPTPPKPQVQKLSPFSTIKTRISEAPAGVAKKVSSSDYVMPKSHKPLTSTIPPPPPSPPQWQQVESDFHIVKASEIPTNATKTKVDTNEEDSRDALLESIRKGVKLKKVDRKSATISGIKPRSERRPQITDFLAELKLGITSRRIKNPEDNPFRED